MLPNPDPKVKLPDVTDDEFFDVNTPEDEALLATGAFDYAEQDAPGSAEPETAVPTKGKIFIHHHKD